jgi:hypothetical protein
MIPSNPRETAIYFFGACVGAFAFSVVNKPPPCSGCANREYNKRIARKVREDMNAAIRNTPIIVPFNVFTDSIPYFLFP